MNHNTYQIGLSDATVFNAANERVIVTEWQSWDQMREYVGKPRHPMPDPEQLAEIRAGHEEAAAELGESGMVRRATRRWSEEGEVDADRALSGSDKCFSAVRFARTRPVCTLLLDFTSCNGTKGKVTRAVGAIAALADHIAAQGRTLRLELIEIEHFEGDRIHVQHIIAADGATSIYSPEVLYPLLDDAHRIGTVSRAHEQTGSRYKRSTKPGAVAHLFPHDAIVSGWNTTAQITGAAR